MPDVHEKSLAHPFPVLDGHGLRLRPWDPESEADVATWLRGLSDPEFQRWNTPVKIVRDLDSARDSLRSRAEAVADGTAVAFCITDAATGTTLGHIGVNDINHVIRVGIVGYWVLPEAAAGRSPPVPSPWPPATPSAPSVCTASNWATPSATTCPAGSPSGAGSRTRGPCGRRCSRRVGTTRSGTSTCTHG